MRSLLALAPLLLLSLPARADEEASLRHLVDALERWDLPAASAAGESVKGDSIDGLEALAMLRFHQGRYGEAKTLVNTLAGKKGAHRDFEETARLILKTEAVTRDFAEKKGPHFIIRYSPAGPDGILADWALETLEAQRAALEQDYGWVPPEVVPVEIFPTADKFAVVTTLTREEIETTGTIALCKFNKLMVTTPGALSFGYPWRDTLAHEYTHYVMARITANKMPIWLHEGLAKYQEVRWRRAKGGEPAPVSESVLATAMAKDHWVTLKQMHPSIAKLPTAFDATLAFAEVESLIGWMVEEKGYAGIRDLLTGLGKDQAMDVVLLNVYGLGLEGLYAKWRVWLAAHPPKGHADLALIPTTLKDPKADADASGASRKGMNDEVADHLRLGDLLAGEVRLDAAIIEYQKAKEAEKDAPTSAHGPIFDYKIASALIAGNRYPEAKKAIVPLLAGYPTFAPALKDAGKIALAENDARKAREYLEQALWQAPFDPETHAMLAESCGKLADRGCADKEHERLEALLKGMGAPSASPSANPSPNPSPNPNP